MSCVIIVCRLSISLKDNTKVNMKFNVIIENRMKSE